MKIFSLFVLAVSSLVISPLWGSGFGHYEHGVAGHGSLGAFVAQAEDASAILHNPAGLARLDRSELIIAGRGLFSQSFYSNTGQSTWDSKSTIDAIPGFFLALRYPKFTLGVGSTGTQQFNLEWSESDFPARFTNRETQFDSQEYMASLAFKLSEKFSVGLTARFAQADTTHSRLLPRPLDLTNNLLFYEVEETFDMDGTGSGFTVGFQYKVPRKFAIGLTYASAIDIDMDGQRRFALFNDFGDNRATNLFNNGFANAPLTSTMELPERIALGVQTKITVRTRLEVDVSQESWSSVDAMVYDTRDSLGQNETLVFPRLWEDALSFRISGDFQQRKALLWRTALASVDSAVPGETVNAYFPDYSRFMYCLGVSYPVRRKYVLEAAWSYIQNRDRFVDDQELFFSSDAPNYQTSNGQRGVFETQRSQLSVGLKIKFGRGNRPAPSAPLAPN